MSHPTGVVAFMFTDIEGSTTAWERDRATMQAALVDHDRIVRAAIERDHGYIFKTVGDAFCAAFAGCRETVSAALAIQRDLSAHDWGISLPPTVRIAIHAGEADERDGDYFGTSVNRVSRLVALGHGGQILLSQTARDLTRDDLPRDVTLDDLGEHRLKDLREPERVYQLVHPDLPSRFPALRSIDHLPHNLPIQLTSFVGREREIAEIRAIIPANRLVTLTGSGGSGKTRIALQVAAELIGTFPDGTWFVDLSPLTDPALIPQTVAQVLGVRPIPGREMSEVLTSYLAQRSLIVLLDNCEHLVEAAAEWSEGVLKQARNVRILATSREALGTTGEVILRVSSLAVPEAGHEGSTIPLHDVDRYEAVRLFAERAALVVPGFRIDDANAAAVVQICRRLDGIPLAIELAAARVRLLTPQEIAARIGDRFRLLAGGRRALSRHQTLRTAIDWSYDLLDDEERKLFRRLSVFTGGWTLEAAETVCEDGGDVFDLLTRLVDKSLVAVERTETSETRYRMLETTRQYAQDKLIEAGETAELMARHGQWCLDLVRRYADSRRGSEEEIHTRRLSRDYENVRAALEWSLASEETAAMSWEAVSRLPFYWYRRGLHAEGIEWIERALSISGTLPLTTHIELHCGLATLHLFHGDFALARDHGDEALALARETGDEQSLLAALTTVARNGTWSSEEQGVREAIAIGEEGLALARKTGDEFHRSILLTNLGEGFRTLGDLERAFEVNRESLETRQGSARVSNLYNLGHIALELGDEQQADERYAEAYRVAREFRDPMGLVNQIGAIAQLSAFRGHHDKAARLFGAFETHLDRMGIAETPPDRRTRERFLVISRDALGVVEFGRAWEEGGAMTVEEALALAYQDPLGRESAPEG
ncbi:MAG TPA: adenylate/guanylate cyclase domain-containing protein [Gemmatimonadota bacterium]|nr:adenylate/guanylate cyclase domain-containing protein [Gemmatimonadota bacterium]